MGGLGRVDPKDEKVTVYLPPRNTTGTAGTIDADLNGNIWVTSPDGALRFDITQETFTEFKSNTYKGPHGTATVYGLAADRVGNGWWLLMTEDLDRLQRHQDRHDRRVQASARKGGAG